MIEDGRVQGAVIGGGDGEQEFRASRGVVLAAGGFPNDSVRRRALFPHAPTGAEHWSPSPPGNTGDGLSLGTQAGAVLETGHANAAAWVPVSLVPYGDGSTGVFPHLIDRTKPGVIAVNGEGRRFVNESESYHDFGQAMQRHCRGPDGIAVTLICDHRAIRRTGLGFVKPFPVPMGRHLRSGYLKRGRTPEALAAALGIDPAALRATIEAFNGPARSGDDPAFAKGSTAFNRFLGDPAQRPNPCVAPLDTPPYYAIRLVLGDLGTFAGLKTDAQARVLDESGKPIPGLYAAGNDMASIMGGAYPAGGITLGPALTFGYIAGKALAEAVPTRGRSKRSIGGSTAPRRSRLQGPIRLPF